MFVRYLRYLASNCRVDNQRLMKTLLSPNGASIPTNVRYTTGVLYAGLLAGKFEASDFAEHLQAIHRRSGAARIEFCVAEGRVTLSDTPLSH